MRQYPEGREEEEQAGPDEIGDPDAPLELGGEDERRDELDCEQRERRRGDGPHQLWVLRKSARDAGEAHAEESRDRPE